MFLFRCCTTSVIFQKWICHISAGKYLDILWAHSLPNETKCIMLSRTWAAMCQRRNGFCGRFKSLFKQFHTCNSMAASVGGLGGTLTFTPVVMCEEDLSYEPAHGRLLMTLIQVGLWGIFQHLRWRTGTIGMTGRTDVTGRTSTTGTVNGDNREDRKKISWRLIITGA